MNEVKLRKYIGKKIKEYRNKKNMTQEELGKIIGVKNNTVSAYERGAISPDSDTLFLIAAALECKVDDLFPPMENQNKDYLDSLKNLEYEGLSVEDLRFLQELIDKTLSLKGEDRAKFLESIRFTVEYYKRMHE